MQLSKTCWYMHLKTLLIYPLWHTQTQTHSPNKPPHMLHSVLHIVRRIRANLFPPLIKGQQHAAAVMTSHAASAAQQLTSGS
jgi:hypothetical protein